MHPENILLRRVRGQQEDTATPSGSCGVESSRLTETGWGALLAAPGGGEEREAAVYTAWSLSPEAPEAAGVQAGRGQPWPCGNHWSPRVGWVGGEGKDVSVGNSYCFHFSHINEARISTLDGVGMSLKIIPVNQNRQTLQELLGSRILGRSQSQTSTLGPAEQGSPRSRGL